MQKRRLSQVGVEAVERLNLPPETAVGVPQVELYGSRQLYMAGHRGEKVKNRDRGLER